MLSVLESIENSLEKVSHDIFTSLTAPEDEQEHHMGVHMQGCGHLISS